MEQPVITETEQQQQQASKKPMPTLTWSHECIQGFVPVAKTRSSQPIEMYYELHGTGTKKIVLLMGMNAACQAWDYQTTHFGAMNEYTVLCFDARGVGWTGGSWDFYNSEHWALDFLELLDQLNWTQDIHAVGHSAGGQALMKALLLNEIPNRFLSASLLNTSAGGLRPLTGPWTIISNLFVKDPKEQMIRLMRTNYTESWLNAKPDDENDSSFDTNFDKLYARMEERNSRNRSQNVGSMISQAIASLRHWVSDKELEMIKKSGISTLVVSNSWDNFAYLSHSEHLATKLSPWKFIVFDDTGHNVPTARSNELNTLLDTFWKHAELNH
ncbi:Alpha/Beta hydrolase protein [Phascolomyces articulosus]|uniref:Alpha/Beta hydrolase protein n=1 Tax=Phascolomyces articulosus TaxID=60185 RepID=A0AAD5KRI5_9FUNG|nr:Alpha/Beta hydrolase protein [Phascolomyces articulosus]